MQNLANHQVDRALSAGAEFKCGTRPLDAAVFKAAGKIVELNVFRETSQITDDEGPQLNTDREERPGILTLSLFEELKQVLFREARYLKRIEALELKIKMVRAQNDALGAALEVARRGTVEATTASPASVGFDAHTQQMLKTADDVSLRKRRRFVGRLFRSRR